MNSDSPIIAFEGISGSGKTTQRNMLCEELMKTQIPFEVTEWNSHPILRPVINKIKDNRAITPLNFCLLHFCDFALRYEDLLNSSQGQRKILIFDRYRYTAIARDTFRGVTKEYINGLYSFCREPDLIIFLDVEPNETLLRKQDAVDQEYYYASGRDVLFDLDRRKSFCKYQEYQMVSFRQEFNLKSNVLWLNGLDNREVITKKIFQEVNKLWNVIHVC